MESRRRTLDARQLGDTVSQILSQGGSFLLTVTGTSMLPTLAPGRDQVELVAPEKLKAGDIIFFRRSTGEYILHRIIRVNGDILTVNGDSQTWTETVRSEQAVGVVRRILRKGKWTETDSLLSRAYSRLWPVTRSARPALVKIKHLFQKTDRT